MGDRAMKYPFGAKRIRSRKSKKRYWRGPRSTTKGLSQGPGYTAVGLTPRGGPFPRVKRAVLQYTQELQLNPATGTYSSNTWSVNSLYDPDYTGTGGQPRYRDTLLGAPGANAPYKYYVVHGAHITFWARNQDDEGCLMALTQGTDALTSPPQTAKQA